MSEEGILEGHNDLLESILFENPNKGIQYRLSITEFRGNNYLSIREYYQDFEGEWMPTKNGCSFPYELIVVGNLFKSLTELLSKAEVLEAVREFSPESDERSS